jgi:L-ribulose-5-phosphate 4-epimerase
MPYDELKEMAWECNRELFRRRLAIYTFGNASAIDRGKGVFAIKPSGIPYDRLRPEEMVVVDLENRVVEGNLRFSSDTRTHAVLYRHFPEIGGVAHTHSPYAVAWAQAMKPVPILGTTHADHLPAEVPCTLVMSDARIKGDYEEETGNLIVETFRDLSYRDVPMVLVAGHGPFTWGQTAEAAVFHSVILEELAKIALFTLQIKPDAVRLNQALIDRHFLRKHGKEATYGQNLSETANRGKRGKR